MNNKFMHIALQYSDCRIAFTLAEILITIGIIGVVAAMTIPSLIANYKEHVIINKAKKNYSIVMQVLQLAQADFGTPNDNSELFLSGTVDKIASNLAKYIPEGKLCLSSSNEYMCKDLYYQVLMTSYKNKYSNLNPPAIILSDNSVIYVSLSESTNCTDQVVSGVLLDDEGNSVKISDGTTAMWTQVRNSCGKIYFDVNGPQKPNKFGYDVFCVGVYPNKVSAPYWDICGYSSLKSILNGGKLIYNKNE